MIKKYLLLLVMAVVFTNVQAQELLSPSFTFSGKKTAYITLKDGTKLEGTIKDLDRKKGLIEEVVLKQGKKKRKLKPEDISHMYLMPSGFDKLTKAIDMLTDMQKWTDEKLDQDLLNQGYVYFENSKVQIKKKQRELLMQLLNPAFSKEVKVYHDPLAKKKKGLAVQGISVTGDTAKSYYVKVGGEEAVAKRLKKKDYSSEFKPMWEACEEMMRKYKKIKWSELTQHIVTYSECN